MEKYPYRGTKNEYVKRGQGSDRGKSKQELRMLLLEKNMEIIKEKLLKKYKDYGFKEDLTKQSDLFPYIHVLFKAIISSRANKQLALDMLALYKDIKYKAPLTAEETKIAESYFPELKAANPEVILEYGRFFAVNEKLIDGLITAILSKCLEEKKIEREVDILTLFPQFCAKIDFKHIVYILLFVGKTKRLTSFLQFHSEANEWVLSNVPKGSASKVNFTEYFNGLVEWIKELISKDEKELFSLKDYPIVYQIFAASLLLHSKTIEEIAKYLENDKVIMDIANDYIYEWKPDISVLYPLFDGKKELRHTQFVDKISQLDQLQGLLKEPVVALDTEWKPYGPPQPSIMQVYSQNYALIFDLFALAGTKTFIDFIYNLFRDPKILKIGHFFGTSDLANFRYALESPAFHEVVSLIDIDVVHKKALEEYSSPSLKSLTAYYLKKQLEKKQQKTNWNKRPLSEDQQVYAITDTLVIYKIFQKMIELKMPGLERFWNMEFETKTAITPIITANPPAFAKIVPSTQTAPILVEKKKPPQDSPTAYVAKKSPSKTPVKYKKKNPEPTQIVIRDDDDNKALEAKVTTLQKNNDEMKEKIAFLEKELKRVLELLEIKNAVKGNA